MKVLVRYTSLKYNDDIAIQSPSFLIQPTCLSDCLSVSRTKFSTFIIQIVKHAGNGKGNNPPPPALATTAPTIQPYSW
jgi:hypothetical protein